MVYHHNTIKHSDLLKCYIPPKIPPKVEQGHNQSGSQAKAGWLGRDQRLCSVSSLTSDQKKDGFPPDQVRYPPLPIRPRGGVIFRPGPLWRGPSPFHERDKFPQRVGGQVRKVWFS